MASGNFHVTTTNGYISGTVHWTSTNNNSANTSKVTAEMRLSRTNSGYTTHGTSTFYVTINGTKRSARKKFSLTHNSNTLMVKGTVTVPHNADGSKSITIGWGGGGGSQASFTVHSGSGTAKLAKIPRESSISSNANWTAGSNKTIKIKRHSSKFTHTVKVEVYNGSSWKTIKTMTNVGASKSTAFSVAQNKQIFQQLNGAASRSSRITITTYSGSTKIGSNVSKTGTVTAPAHSTIPAGKAGITNPTGISSASGQGNQTVWIDQNVNIKINSANSHFKHTLKFKDGNNGSVIHTATNVGTSYTWSPTTAEQNKLYEVTKNQIEKDGQIDVYTYYEGVQVRNSAPKDINYRVRNSNPTFSASAISYKDVNSATTGITGNNQYIIQKESTLRASIDSAATGKNKATIDHYIISVSGHDKTVNSATTHDFTNIDSKSNVTLTVKAMDSRGLSTTVSKTVKIIPYSRPSIAAKAQRDNGFEENTVITLHGEASPLKVGSTNKNSISSARYRYKKSSETNYGSWNNFTYSGFPNYVANNVQHDFDSLVSWDIEIKVVDKLDSRSTTLKVNVGKPILFLDPDKGSMGFGDYPTTENTFFVNGTIRFGANQYAAGPNMGENGFGALNMNNSDITGLNGLYMNDVSNNPGEGLMWLKNGATAGSSDRGDYDQLYVHNGDLQMNRGSGTFSIRNKDIRLNTDDGQAILYNNGAFYTYSGGTNIFQLSSTGNLNVVSNIYSSGKVQSQGNIYINANSLGNDGGASYVGMSVSNDAIGGGHAAVRIGSTQTNPSSALMYYGSDGSGARLFSNSQTLGRGYAGNANMEITGSWTLGKTSSSRKYKVDEQVISLDYANKILELDPKSYFEKRSLQEYIKLENPEDAIDVRDYRFPGLMAEDVEEKGLDLFLEYMEDDEGNKVVDGINHKMWILFIPIIRELKQEVSDLREQLNAQKEGTTNG